jgi:hypothetical protein
LGEYEIRITDGNRHTILAIVHLNDNAAVRQAERMAEGKPFEVWRGMDCIYGTVRSHHSEPGEMPSPPV